MAWVCVNSGGVELIFETEPHKVAYSWRDNEGSCRCIALPNGSIKKKKNLLVESLHGKTNLWNLKVNNYENHYRCYGKTIHL